MMKDLEAAIGYRFHNISLLQNALAHSSYANERWHNSLMKHKIFKRNWLSMIGYLFCKKGVDEVMGMMDYREIGGTEFLGIKKPVLKCHGNSDRLAFRNGIRQAMIAAESNFTQQLEQDLAALKERAEA